MAAALRLPAAGSDISDRPSLLGPADLSLTFRSPFDGSEQPYRLYLPSAYNNVDAVPLLVALHGTDGDQNKYFDYPEYGSGLYKRAAEQRGLAILCPLGNDARQLPTEWRGIGELHVLAAIEEVCRRFRIDRDRIVCSGQSMGGTGTTYLCCRYPDIFAGGVPLASTYGHLSLATNLRYVPMFYIQGEHDWPVYARTGPIPLTRALQELGYDATLWMVQGAEHNTMKWSTERVLDWALERRRVRHPRRVTFRSYFPLHGRAYWTEIQEITTPGSFAEIDAHIAPGNHIVVSVSNASQVVLRPEPELFDTPGDITVEVNGQLVFQGGCPADREIRLRIKGGECTATLEARQVRLRTTYPAYPVGIVVSAPNWDSDPETTLGNWLTDAMRDATGADIALCSRGHYRGIPLRAGQTVDMIDLINWLRPSDSALAKFTATGAQVREIIEDNIRTGPNEGRQLLQVSGCRYRFNRARPQGRRIVSTDLVATQEYTVVCELSALTRTDTMHLAGRFGEIPFTTLDFNTVSTAWRFIVQNQGKISATLEGRVQVESTDP
jgi:poly(3-hydroxybutyrate) depolymerase